MSSGLKSSSKLHQDLLRSPPDSFSKQDDTLLSQNKSGVKSGQREEPTRSQQVPVQPFVDTPPRAQSQTFNFITMRKFQIESTITRARICKSVLLLTAKMLSMVTAAVFWLSVLICLKTLLNWQAPWRILYELIVRWFSASTSTTSIWRLIFIGTNYSDSYYLRLTVHRSSYLHSPSIYSISTPLLLENPMVWFSVMLLMFISHHLSCLAHDCLNKISPTIRPAN